MSMNNTPKALVGIIGGSGLYKMDNLILIEEVNPETPWGYPSSPITIAALSNGTHVAFLARHGVSHSINPTAVPARANIAALSSIGVKAIIAFSAVGSLREEIAPGDFIIPDQIIDRTKGIRPASFFEGTDVVAHAMFGDPFDNQLVAAITPLVKEVLDGGKKLHERKTVVCMEGPQFSTRAESQMYRQWGGDIINMSVLPEAKLAQEAEISYALIATSTDYDAWRVDEHPVTVSEVLKTLHDNAEAARRVAGHILGQVHTMVEKKDILTRAVESMKYSIITPPQFQTAEDREKLAYILPKYFS